MKNIIVIYGGKSVEHDISVITALQVMKNISSSYFVVPVYIAPTGQWWTGDNLFEPSIYYDFDKLAKNKKMCSLVAGAPVLATLRHGKMKEQFNIDCALVCCHGGGGEGGQLAGMLEMCQIPYTSASAPSSAICQDKVLCKILLQHFNYNTMNFYAISKRAFDGDKTKLLKSAAALTYPLIVKPARLGSSVGIKVANDDKGLLEAVEEGLLYDDKVLCEEFLTHSKEFTCAALRVGDKIFTSRVDFVEKGKMFTFEDKYLKISTKKHKINEILSKKIKEMTQSIYEDFELDGVIRVDYLCDKDEKIYVCEINTIPGSLAFNLFEGVTFCDLIDNLIIEGQNKKERSCGNVYSFSSNALEQFISLSNVNKYTKL